MSGLVRVLSSGKAGAGDRTDTDRGLKPCPSVRPLRCLAGRHRSSHRDRLPCRHWLLVPSLLIAAKADEVEVRQSRVSLLANRLDVVPCGEVGNGCKFPSPSAGIMFARKQHGGTANTAFAFLQLKSSLLSPVLVIALLTHAEQMALFEALASLGVSVSSVWVPLGEARCGDAEAPTCHRLKEILNRENRSGGNPPCGGNPCCGGFARDA